LARQKCIWDSAPECLHPLVGENKTNSICLNCSLREGILQSSKERKSFFASQLSRSLGLLLIFSVFGASIGCVVPGIVQFEKTVTVVAANREVTAIKIAGISYLIDHGQFPEDSTRLISYCSGSLQAAYTINTNTGDIVSVNLLHGSKWEGAKWDSRCSRLVQNKP
jgi:hypothetical protein